MAIEVAVNMDRSAVLDALGVLPHSMCTIPYEVNSVVGPCFPTRKPSKRQESLGKTPGHTTAR